MNEKYDVIVIGAGNAGLIAALELVKSEKKVLVLEKNNVPGGAATSFVKGIFEFEAALNELCEYGTKENPGEVYKLFEKLGVNEKLEFNNTLEAFNVYCRDTNMHYEMPFGINEFIAKMEEYVPKSSEALKKFFYLAEECKNAIFYLEENKEYVDTNYLKKNFPNFLKVATSNVDKVLDILKLPKKAQEILSTYWLYFGSPTSTLSFVHFASIVYSFISKGSQIPSKKSHQISLTLAEEIERLGGEIKYLSTVKEILFKDKKIAGVLLENGDIYETKHLISNISPNTLYSNMMPEPLIPSSAIKLTNSRVLGARGFSIFLGLNQSAKDLGLDNYNYYIYDSLNSEKEYQNMSNIKNTSCVATILNNVVNSASPKGTTILHFTKLFMGDTFSKNITEKNYFEMKDKIAEDIIDDFEVTTGIVIKPYIEEIEIKTPVTYAKYFDTPDGVIFGYKATGMDNYLPRMISLDEENYIKNLRFCGGFDVKLSGYCGTYLSGDLAARLTLKDIKMEGSDE